MKSFDPIFEITLFDRRISLRRTWACAKIHPTNKAGELVKQAERKDITFDP